MAVNMKTVTDLLGDYVDRSTLAEAWGICPRTVAAYEKQGLPSIVIGGKKRYPINGISAFLKSREQDGRHG